MSTSSVILQNKRKRISFKLGHSLELFTTLFRCMFSVEALTNCFTLSRFLSLLPRKYRSYNCPRQFFVQCGESERLWISTGSGKTNTGIKLVYLFCKINRQLEAEGKGKKTVLYCGPSNKSVDLVASKSQNSVSPGLGLVLLTQAYYGLTVLRILAIAVCLLLTAIGNWNINSSIYY